MKIVLFEDNHSNNLHPIGLFNPLYELKTACWSIGEIAELTGIPVIKIVREHLLNGDDENPSFGEETTEPFLFLNASLEPDVNYLKIIDDMVKSGSPFISTSGKRVSVAFVPPGKKLPKKLTTDGISSILLEMELPLENEMFKTIDWPHEVVGAHIRLCDANIEKIIEIGFYTEKEPGFFIGENVNLAPFVAVDTSKGPVVIDNGVKVMQFTYLQGPVHIGADTLIIEHSAIKSKTCIGRRCKIGGEIEDSSIKSYSNKQHHGFLGHSWVGSWVNLGAGTSTSDLKNTYGKIRVDYRNMRVDTNMQFLGSIIGDYVKTAVNTSIFTGKMLGVCSMIYGTVTSNVPSFSNYARNFGQVTEISLDQVIKTQKRVFQRRGVEQTAHDITMMKRVFDITRSERVMSEEQINF